MSDSKKPLALYTKYEAAEILRVKVSWLERRAQERRIPFTMLGGEYRFTDEHLAQIVRQFEHAPEDPDAESMPPSRQRRTARRRVPAAPAPVHGVAPLKARPRRPRGLSA